MQFVLAVLIDIADFAFPIGYIIGVVGEIYLYNWAVDYLSVGRLDDDTKNTVTKIKNKTQGNMSRNLMLRLVLEFIPFLNFLPITIYFVYSVWREKTNMKSKNIVV